MIVRTLVLSALLLTGLSLAAQAVMPEPATVKALMQRVADWQMLHMHEPYSRRPFLHHPLEWTNAALYVGLEKWARIADEGSYDQFLTRVGNKHDWQLHERRYHADPGRQ